MGGHKSEDDLRVNLAGHFYIQANLTPYFTDKFYCFHPKIIDKVN